MKSVNKMERWVNMMGKLDCTMGKLENMREKLVSKMVMLGNTKEK